MKFKNKLNVMNDETKGRQHICKEKMKLDYLDDDTNGRQHSCKECLGPQIVG